MNIDLPYGKGKRSVKIPDGVKVDYLIPKEMTSIDDPYDALVQACWNTIDSPPLTQLVGGCKSVLILVSDVTRDSGTSLLLPHLVRHLKELGFEPPQIKTLVARGTHRKLTKEEKKFFTTGELKGTSFADHNCDETRGLSALLLTSKGTPVRINRLLKESDLVILMAPISFHYFAGFGGGRKLILPGCADRNSIVSNHRLSLLDERPVTLNPSCDVGALGGNPVHEDMLEALGALGNTFAINFFSDTRENLVFINAGFPIVSHLTACDVYNEVYSRQVEEPYDLLLVSAGGFPHDINLLQSHKSLRQASFAVEEGGTILFLAECEEGIGSEPFENALRIEKRTFMKEAYKNYQLNNQAVVSLHSLTEQYEIGMVTGLDDISTWIEGINRCENLEAFLAAALEKSKKASMAVVPYGGKTLPRSKGRSV